MDKTRRLIEMDEVIAVKEDVLTSISNPTFKLDEFLQAFKTAVSFPESDSIKEMWLVDGVECEILSPGKGWQKGKLRINLEFYPSDEPEVPETPTSNQPETSQPQSPLDDIRRMINQ